MKTKLQGEQFRVLVRFTENGYSECEQIVVCVYNTITTDEIIFLKQPDTQYPNAKTIEQIESIMGIGLWFSEDMTKTMLGQYDFEIKRVIAGEKMPIVKTVVEVVNIKKSRT